MSIRLTVSVSKKAGTPNFGSHGGECGLEVELADTLLEDAVKLASAIRAHFRVCAAAVDDELRQLGRAGTNGTASATEMVATTPAPSATNGHAPSRNGHQTPKPPMTEYDEPGQVGADAGDDDEDAPTTGRQLLGWSQKQPGDAKGFMIRFGKKRDLPPRILDWNESQVATAYRAYRQAMNGPTQNGGR